MSFFPTTQYPTHLVECNAGKCIRENNTIKPDLRKGVIYMDQSDDQLMHFYWKERKSAEPEEDLIIFPDEAEMIRVKECTTGRVYLLKFKSSDQKLFFWMQNKDDEKDEECITKINRLINDPQGAIDEGRSSSRMDLSNDSQDLMQILGESGQDIGMSQENLMQFLQAAGGFGGNSAPTASTRAGGDDTIENSMDVDENDEPREQKRLSGTQVDSLKEILANTTVAEDTTATKVVTLSDDVASVDALNALLQNDALRQALFPNVPNVESTARHSHDEVSHLIQSEHFQLSLKKIDKALEDGSLDSILSSLGLDASADINIFLKAIEEQAKSGQQQAQSTHEESMEH
ncbi:proteasome complex subunit Rpn13 ubiquitin receptor-domain-containing protein [Absidia repens]|uniref:Proteasome complex subunit Rpn13 ubiquitin receptor-domain-containing protein n=1 Tax=Absidia repens TaxID=90262 RepID=A0A1X2J336_9FUNG|nr:proteasome complex subunit Rpn13 ubiquitin receptor-domain-containing protein [Absidia repens]